MYYKKITVTCCAAAALLCSTGWLDSNFAQRTKIDVDEFRHPAGKEVMLTLDPARLEKCAGMKLVPGAFKLGFTDASGKESEIAFAADCSAMYDKKLRLSFTMPAEKGKIHLYFNGKGKAEVKKHFDVLGGASLDARKYQVERGMELTAKDKGINIRQTGIIPTNKRAENASADLIVPVKSEFAGMPVTLCFDAQNYSKAIWPISISVQNLDGQKKVIGDDVFDRRWTMMQTVPEKPFYLRQAGVIDPRAKYLKVRLSILRVNEQRPFDVFGKPLKDPASAFANMDITRFELIPGYPATLPGTNEALYTEGVKPGTSALKFTGKTSVLYNNFPSRVWGGGDVVRNQDMFFWPLGTEGTAEFYVKFDEEPKKDIILLDNARNNAASFLRLEYQKGKLLIKMNGYDQKTKIKGKSKAYIKQLFQVTKSAPVKFAAGKWTHIAATWSKSGFAVYVDGKKIISGKESVTPAAFALLPKNRKAKEKINIAEYTCVGADGHRYFDIYNGVYNNNYFKGAVDELRVSKVVRYKNNFTPAKEFAADADTCALFSYEKNFDGVYGAAKSYISGSIFTADVPPRADTFEVENKDGKTQVVRYVPKDIPAENMPEYHIRQTSYPVLPVSKEYYASRVSKKVTKKVKNGDSIEFTTQEHTVPEYVEIKAVDKPVAAPFLSHKGEIDPRSYADIVRTMDFSDCSNDHAKTRKLFDFLVGSTDYYTFQGAEFVKYSNQPMHAASNGLVAINSYTSFQCGPLNGIASGLFTNGLGFPSVLTFGNGHLFQQVVVEGKLRVFDLSAQKYWPSRDQDDAASLDELEKDVYLFYRTRKGPPKAISHFFRMGSRSGHSDCKAPRERLAYTLYPGESFRYYPASCGYSQDLKALTWQGKRHSPDSWVNMQTETGSNVEVGRAVQRLLPHIAQGVYKFRGKVAPGAFSSITEDSFCYRIDSPYTIIHGVYSVPDENATFELSYDKGRNWRKVNSVNGVCTLEFELRGRHAGLLKVNTKSRDFKADTITQMSYRRMTGLARAGKNSIRFSSDSGDAEVTVTYRERAKDIIFAGGFYSGTVPGLERQLFTLEPGKSRTIKVTGVSKSAKVKASGGLEAVLKDGKLVLTAPADTVKGVKYVIVTDGNAQKAIDVLVCKNVKEFSIKDFKGKVNVRKADATRPQDAVFGNAALNISDVAPGKYVIFTLTRRDNRVGSMPQATIRHGKVKVTAARYRNPSFDFYKAGYGPYMANRFNPDAKLDEIDPWSRLRWDTSTGRDTYPHMIPLEITVEKGDKPLKISIPSADCSGVILMPSEDRNFMYFTIANLHHMSRADWLFNGYLDPIY